MITLDKFLEEAKRTIAQDPDLPKSEGSKPKKYHVGLSKSTKKSRDEHFKANRDKADNDPSAYGPAPGDEKVKTKESKYTKAYKKRFGEDVDLQYLDDEFFMEEVDHLFPCEYEVLDEEMIEEAGDTSSAMLKKKSEKSGIPMGILRSVYNRGMSAWKGGHRPGTTPQQWAAARVNSFISGGKTRTTADKDLWAKASAAKKKKKGKNSGPPKKKSSKQ